MNPDRVRSPDEHLTLRLILAMRYRAGDDADALEDRAVSYLVMERGWKPADAGREAQHVVQLVVAEVDGATGNTP